MDGSRCPSSETSPSAERLQKADIAFVDDVVADELSESNELMSVNKTIDMMGIRVNKILESSMNTSQLNDFFGRKTKADVEL
jgi:hypothetical protein